MHRHSSPTAPLPTGRGRGVLLVELLIALVVLAVLAALALPSFHLLLRLHRVRSAVAELQADIVWARAESIRRAAPVVLRMLSAPECPPSPAEPRLRCRWIVFVDRQQDELRQEDETLLRAGATPATTAVRYSPVSEAVGFDTRGNTSNMGNSFTVLATGAAPEDPTTRTLCISRGGRIRVEQGSAC